MSTLDPQYNKRLAALLRRPEMATRDALKEILTSIRVEHAALTRAQEAHQREMAASMQALDRRMAEHEAAIEEHKAAVAEHEAAVAAREEAAAAKAAAAKAKLLLSLAVLEIRTHVRGRWLTVPNHSINCFIAARA
mgnify:CR=1 FL=1